MCVIVHYLCQKCKEATGQRDYISHTDGQRFAIPRAEPSMDVISFCPDIRAYRAVIHDPLLQSPGFPCENKKCPAFKVKLGSVYYCMKGPPTASKEHVYGLRTKPPKVKLEATKSQKQDANILAKLRDTAYRITVEGYSFTDVKEKLKQEGIKTVNIRKLPGAKVQKWNLYTEEKLRKMSAKGESYDDIKTALKAITNLSYTTYQIIAKAASLKLQQSLFPLDPSRPMKTL